MKFTRVYADEHGESHFGDLDRNVEARERRSVFIVLDEPR